MPRIGDLTGLRRAALETRRVQLRAAPANAVTHSGADRGLATPVALPTPPSAKGFPARQVNTAALAATLNQVRRVRACLGFTPLAVTRCGTLFIYTAGSGQLTESAVHRSPAYFA